MMIKTKLISSASWRSNRCIQYLRSLFYRIYYWVTVCFFKMHSMLIFEWSL